MLVIKVPNSALPPAHSSPLPQVSAPYYPGRTLTPLSVWGGADVGGAKCIIQNCYLLHTSTSNRAMCLFTQKALHMCYFWVRVQNMAVCFKKKWERNVNTGF